MIALTSSLILLYVCACEVFGDDTFVVQASAGLSCVQHHLQVRWDNDFTLMMVESLQDPHRNILPLPDIAADPPRFYIMKALNSSHGENPNYP
ncbi:MAG: hypothetical protein ABIH23_15975 [bacterium]